MVNNVWRVFDKSGTPLTPPRKLSSIWASLGGPCAGSDWGDPIVLYDTLADRWLLSQLCLSASPPHQLIALSQTSDPTGAYFLYDFVMPFGAIYDYPKFGVWPDGYYMTANQFHPKTFVPTGGAAFAFDRAKMLVGDPHTTYIYFDLRGVDPTIGGHLPSDLDGLNPPPPGTPNYFMDLIATEFGFPTDGLRIFEFHADFANPGLSTFRKRPESPVAVAACDPTSPSGRDDVEQPPPAETSSESLDSLNDTQLMHRLAYRNFGVHESLVLNHTVNVGTGATIATHQAAVRYYEVRRSLPGGAFGVPEQASFAPDADNRWMGSAAMDNGGNIAVGYSVSSLTTFPSIRYAGRLASDPPDGLFQGEASLQSGSFVQRNTLSRWGDYSAMNVDPVDDCTFWYTNEYYALDDPATDSEWQTRIGRFAFPSCTPAAKGTIRGVVTSTLTGLPIAGALVRTPEGYLRTTDASGAYSTTLVPGTYRTEASKPGFFTQSAAGVVVTDGGTTIQDFALAPAPVIPPPPNDDVANARVITALPFTETVDARVATVESFEIGTDCERFPRRTIWYKFTPATALRVDANNVGSSTANVNSLALYIGDPSSFPRPVACDNGIGGPCGRRPPRIVFDLMPGNTYFFQISSSNTTGATTVFSLAPAPPPPPNDDFDQATAIGALPFNDSVNTISATLAADDPPSCGPGGATVWYRFTPPVDFFVLADTAGSDFSAVIEIFTGARGALVRLPGVCSACSLGTRLTGGVTYFFKFNSNDFDSDPAEGNLRFRLRGESLAGVPPRQASKVFGQTGFVSNVPNSGGRSAARLSSPTGVAVDASGGHLYVADRGNHRILEYDSPLTGDTVADRVFGQPDFITGTANTGGISAASLNFPTELSLDVSGNLYVAEFNNNRVLRYDNPLADFMGALADLVIGQPDFTTGTANTGGLSAGSLSGPSGVAVDAQGSLYVGEFFNNRVLRFDSPLVNGDTAGVVLGQAGFSTNTSNAGGLSASSLSVATDVMLDPAGNLYVSDTGNGRVLKFGTPLTSNQAAADLVLGQSDFTTPRDLGVCGGLGVSASTLCDPRGLATDCAGNLYVADLSHSRVLLFRDPLTTDTVADEVLGHFNFGGTFCNAAGLSAGSLCGPRGVAVDDLGNLYVADTGNNRVLMFEGDPDLDGVKGSLDACPCEAPSSGLDADRNGCTDTIAGLKTIVQGLSIDSKLKNGLLGKLNEAQKALDRGNTLAAVNKLRDFITQVEGQRGKGISASDADMLVAYANNLINLISP